VLARAHLTERDIERYLAGRPTADADRHVRLCVFCALRVGDATQRAFGWERRGPLRRLVRVDPAWVVERLLDDLAREQQAAP
jgi:hypothetical protein